MKLKCTAKKYCIEIPTADFLRFTGFESLYDGGGPDRQGFTGKTLSELLQSLEGIGDVEYSGHYGSFIYFTLDIEHDHAKHHRKIIKVIEARIKEALVAAA